MSPWEERGTGRGSGGVDAAAEAAFTKARECWEAGSAGGPLHNLSGASSLFSAAVEFLEECEGHLK